MNIDKIINAIGTETAGEMGQMSHEQLKQEIYKANQAMKEVQDELDANQEYQALLQGKKDMEAGKREVNKRQNAKIQYALHIIEGDDTNGNAQKSIR